MYAQVTSLFSSAPDLLEDFKQFLPESAAQHRAAQQQAARHAAEDAVMLSNVRGEQTYQPAPPHQHQTPRTDTSRLPPMGNFAPTPTANRDNKRKRGERQAPGVSSSAMPTSMVGDAGSTNARAGYGQGNLAKVREEMFIHVKVSVDVQWCTDQCCLLLSPFCFNSCSYSFFHSNHPLHTLGRAFC